MKIQLRKTAILLAFIIFVMPIFVSAAPSAGIKPSSVFYFFDVATEHINLFFTFNPENKARKALEYADERLAEAVAEGNNSKSVKTAITNYESNIAYATEESKQIKDKGKAEVLFTSISDSSSKHQEILAEIYNKVSDEAKKTVEKAIETSEKNQKEALEETQKLKKTVEELQKDIESLKQQGQSDQDKEIAELRKEVEALKSQPSKVTSTRIIEKVVEVPPNVPQKNTQKLSNSEIIDKIKPAVVYIQTSDGSGSGMIIENDGYVLTNAHVVSGVSIARVKLSDDRLFVASVVGRDENIDLALLKIKGDNLPVVVLGDSSINTLKQGDEVFAFGYPFGLEGDVSFKEGTISRRQTYEGITYLETSAQIHPGNSGGPLVNRLGEVVGVNTASLGSSSGETIKFALPINLARGLIPELKSGRNIVLPKATLPSVTTPLPTPTPTQPYTPPQATSPAPTPVIPVTPIIPIVVKTLEVTSDRTSVPASGYDGVIFKIQYKEYGYGKVSKIEIIAPDPSRSEIHDHDYGCSFNNNCSLGYSYTIPAQPGTYSFTFRAEGIEKTVNIEATPFVEIKPQVTITQTRNTFPPGYTGADGLASLTLDGLDNEGIIIKKIKYDVVSNDFTLEDIQLAYNNYAGIGSTHGILEPGYKEIRKGDTSFINLGINIGVWQGAITSGATKLGTLQVIISSITASGEKSGATKELLQSPVTLDVTIQ